MSWLPFSASFEYMDVIYCHYIFYSYSAGIDIRRQNLYQQTQILTSKIGLCAERVNRLLICEREMMSKLIKSYYIYHKRLSIHYVISGPPMHRGHRGSGMGLTGEVGYFSQPECLSPHATANSCHPL